MFPRTLARNALSQSLRGALREAAPARQHALPALARSTAPATHFAAPFSSSSRALKEDTPAKKVEEGEEKRAAEGAALGADADAAAKNGTGGEMEAALKEKDAKIKELQVSQRHHEMCLFPPWAQISLVAKAGLETRSAHYLRRMKLNRRRDRRAHRCALCALGTSSRLSCDVRLFRVLDSLRAFDRSQG